MNIVIYVLIAIMVICLFLTIISHNAKKELQDSKELDVSSLLLNQIIEDRHQLILKEIYLRANTPVCVDLEYSKATIDGFNLMKNDSIIVPMKYEQVGRKNQPISEKHYKDTVDAGVLTMLAE